MTTDSPTADVRLDEFPRLRRDLIDRPRLLDIMASRFDRPLTIITAGAGFGKTTLLTQAVHDPVASARGIDTVHRITDYDNDAPTLTSKLIALLTGSTPDSPAIDQLINALWSDSPRHVTIILDDIHRLADDSASWTTLDSLIEALPTNAHLVLSGRGRLNLKLAKLLVSGEAQEISEDMLAFDATDLDAFAQLRSVDRDRINSHGWPALVELEAHSGVAGAHRFVAEEVLNDLDPGRVDALRLVALHNVIDDEMVLAVTESTLTAANLVAGLPLTTSIADGVFRLHDLWRDLLIAPLSADQRSRALGKTARILLSRGALRSACETALDAGDLETAREVLVEFSRDIQFAHSVADRNALCAAVPPELLASPEVLLLQADMFLASEPSRADPELRRVLQAARDANRGEIEVLTLIRIGDVAYRSGNVAGLEAAQAELVDLASAGTPGARAAQLLLDVWRLMVDNAAIKALAVMDMPEFQAYEPVAAMTDYYRAVQFGHAGQCEKSLAAIEDLQRRPRGRILNRMGGFTSIMKWYLGQLTAQDLTDAVRLLDTIDQDRQLHLYVEGSATVAMYTASAGDLVGAQAILAKASVHRDQFPAGAWGLIELELATAVLDLVSGDEPMAAARLEEIVPETGPFVGFPRHVFGNVSALLYALVPRTRAQLDAEDTGADLTLATDVGRALASLREHGQQEPAARLPWEDLSRLRTWAYEPHLAELALAAVAQGVVRANQALDSLVIRPRATLLTIAERYDGAISELVNNRLTTTPSRPSVPLRIGVLGSLEVTHGDMSQQDSAPMRRKMVRELLMLLVHRRRIRRVEAMDILWPDKEESAASNNLRATLMHLRTLLETHGPSDGTTDTLHWHLRSDGDYLSLFESDLLLVDADEFSRLIDIGRVADRNRKPAEALTSLRAAVDMYHGAYISDADDPDWAYHQRINLHLDFVEAATRCSELLTAQGLTTEAVAFAGLAVEAESLSEPAHRAMIRALHQGGDRAGASRAFKRVITVLEADGLSPEDATIRLGSQL